MTNNIVNKTIRDYYSNNNLSISNYYTNKDKGISYDVEKLNILKSNIEELIQSKLMNIDNGLVEEYFLPNRIQNSRFKKIKNGIICDISIYSLNASSLFANIGPTIPLKLTFSDQLKSDIDVKVREYGINNAFIEVDLIVTIKEQVIMPLSSKRKKIVIKEPLIIDIVQGNIPNYYIK